MDVEKEKRLKAFCKALGCDGLLLRRRSNIAWITDGADVHCDTAQATGVASALWTPKQHQVLTNTIEAPRLQEEEFPAGWTFEVTPWWEGRKEAPHNFATDWPDPNRRPKKARPGLDDSDAITALRLPLTPHEVERVRALGHDVAETMQQFLQTVKPGVTEHEIAGTFAAALRRQAIHAPVLLVAADDRIAKFRHPIPTKLRLERTLMLVVCAQRHGLIVAATRIVHFGKLPAQLKRKHAAVCAIDASMIAATKVGAKWSEVLAAGIRTYRDEGFGTEWRLHHQGGPIGYECRDFLVTPSTPGTIAEGQLAAWNPSISGTKSEDTVLAGGEVVTAMANWPLLGTRPDILVRRQP